MCKACENRDATGAGKLARFQQLFAKDLDPASPCAPQTLGDMTDRLKVTMMLESFGLSTSALFSPLVYYLLRLTVIM